jgi:hypothetical protein
MTRVLVFALTLSSCGGGAICARYMRTFGDCSDETADERKEMLAGCEQDFEEFCTADDRVKYDAWLDCWRKSDLGCPDDITDTDSEEFQAMEDCDAELEGRTDTCVASGP